MTDQEHTQEEPEVPSCTAASTILTPAAQTILVDTIKQLRSSDDLSAVLEHAITSLTQVCAADRGLIWQVDGAQLTVTNEFSRNGENCFLGRQLDPQESTMVVLDFLSRFPDESADGFILVPDTTQDDTWRTMAPSLSSLMDSAQVRSRFLIQLRSRGIFSGFVEIQRCDKPGEWSKDVTSTIISVGGLLSVVVQQSFDQSRIELDAKELRLMNEFSRLFRDSRGRSTDTAMAKSGMLLAEFMGLVHSQIYLANESSLVPQQKDGVTKPVLLTDKTDPVVGVFTSGKAAIVYPSDDHDLLISVPLTASGDHIGVISLWQRVPNRSRFRPQDREFCLTAACQLAELIRADQPKP
jgi:hypothetical protein